MFEERVSNVRGRWNATSGTTMLELRYEVNGEEEVTLHVPMHLLGAVSTWLKNPQPPPPTPDEIAADIVDEWHSVPIERNALRRRIAEAIKTERERHDV